jgi:hypothetical protein
MSRRKNCQQVLDSEMNRWSAMSDARLVSELLDDHQEYQVEFESEQYNVEVELIENSAQYLHVVIAVDDGTLPGSMSPLCNSIIRWRVPPGE